MKPFKAAAIFLFILIGNQFDIGTGTFSPDLKSGVGDLNEATADSGSSVLSRSLSYLQRILESSALLGHGKGEERPSEHHRSLSEIANSTESLRNFIRSRLQHYKSEVKAAHSLNTQYFTDDQSQFDEEAQNLTSVEGHGPGHNHHSLHRQKRTVIEPYNTVPGRRRRNITQIDFDGANVVRRAFRLNPQPFDNKALVDLTVLPIKREDIFIFTIEKATAQNAGLETVVYKVLKDLTNIQEIARISTPDAKRVEVFRIDFKYYVLPITSSSSKATALNNIDDGSKLYQFDYAKQSLQKVQTIQTPNAQTSHFWIGSGQEANDVYLAIAPGFIETNSQRRVFKVEIPIYRWQGGYFDFMYSITGYNPQSIRYAAVSTHEFLAIANYQDSPESTSVHSEIFKYNHKISKFVTFQKILTHGAKDIQYFSFENGQRGEHFLAIANHGKFSSATRTFNYKVKSQIFKFATEKFIPFQSFETFGAFQVLPVKSGKGFLLVVGEINQLRIVQYNGWRFVETTKVAYSDSNAAVNFIRLSSFDFDDQPYFGVASNDISKVQSGLFSLEFEQKTQITTVRSNLEKWCKAAVAKIESTNITELVEQVREAPKVSDAEVRLKGDLTFASVKSNLFSTEVLNFDGQQFDARLSQEWAARERQLKELEQSAKALEIQLGNAIRKDTNQQISTNIKFTNVVYTAPSLKATEVTTRLLNGVNVNDLFAKMIFLNQNYKFQGVTADTVEANRLTFQKLNSNALSEYAQKSEAQIFTQENVFKTSISLTKGISLIGSFDGVDFNNINFLLLRGNQTFSNPINIQQSIVNNLISNEINDVNLDFYMNEAILTSESIATISGAKEFQFMDVKNLQANKISNVDINKLYSEAIKLDSKSLQTFTGSAGITFDKLTTKNLQVESSILNNKFNVKDLVLIHGRKYTFDSLELTEDTLIQDLQVSRFLNSIKVIDGKLDVILKNSDSLQIIANKKLNEITLSRNAIAFDLVDGINLTNWSPVKRIELNSNNYNFQNMKINGELTISPGILIDFERSRVSTFQMASNDVAKLLSKALLLSATSLPSFFNGKIIFQNLDVLGETTLTRVNTISPNTDWLLNTQNTKTTTVTITGQKTFLKNLEFKEAITARKGLFNSTTNSLDRIDFLKVAEILLLKKKDQDVFESTKFSGTITVDNLQCSQVLLNGIRFDQLLLKSGNQAVSGKVVFEKPIKVETDLDVRRELEVGKVLINKQLWNLAELIKDTLLVKSENPQRITGQYEFTDKLQVHGSVNWNPTSNILIGGFNISTLLSNIVRNDGIGSNVINGQLTFNKPVKADRLEFTGHLNGRSHLKWGEGFLLSSGNQIISTPVKFGAGLFVDKLTVTNDKISNVDFVRLANDALRIDEHGELGVITFAGLVETPHGLSLSNRETTVNGFNIFTDLLLNNQKSTTMKQTITETKSFSNGFNVHGNLNVAEIDGFNYNQAVYFVKQQTKSEDNLHIQGDLVLEHEPKFTTTFNDQNWQKLLENIWWLNQPTTISSQHITFDKIILESGGKSSNGLINDIDINLLQEDYLSKSKDQKIDANKVIFENGIQSAIHLTTENVQILNDGLLNGINLVKFLQNVLLNGANQTIKSKFKFGQVRTNKIIIGENVRVGGLDLDIEAIRINSINNVLVNHKNVQSLTVTNILSLNEQTKLNGIDLQEWNKNAVKNNYQNVNINGNVQLQQGIFQQNINALGTVDGVVFSRETIVTKSGDQKIEGTIILPEESVVFVSSDAGITTVTYNGQDLKALLEDLVRTDLELESDEELLIYGEKTFTKAIHSESLVAESKFQGQNLTEVLSTLKPESFISTDFNSSLQTEYNDLISRAENLLKLSNRKAMFLNYFELSDSIRSSNFINFKTLHLGTSNAVSLAYFKKVSSRNSVTFQAFNHASGLYEKSTFGSLDITGDIIDVEEVHSSTGNYYLLVSSLSGASSSVSVYKLTQSTGLSVSASNFQLATTISGNKYGSLTTFEIRESSTKTKNCFLAIDYGVHSTSTQTTVYCLDESLSNVELNAFQELPIDRPSSATSLLLESSTVLFISSLEEASTGENSETRNGVVEVWLQKGRLFERIDCLPIVNLVSMSAINGPNSNSFLALASGQFQEHAGSVYLYKYIESSEKFVKVLSISVVEPSQVEFQVLNHEAFLYVLNSASFHNIQVYAFRGKFGWVKEHAFTSKNAKLIRSTGFQLGPNLNAQLLVGNLQDQTISVFNAVFHGKKKRSRRLSNSAAAASENIFGKSSASSSAQTSVLGLLTEPEQKFPLQLAESMDNHQVN